MKLATLPLKPTGQPPDVRRMREGESKQRGRAVEFIVFTLKGTLSSPISCLDAHLDVFVLVWSKEVCLKAIMCIGFIERHDI